MKAGPERSKNLNTVRGYYAAIKQCLDEIAWPQVFALFSETIDVDQPESLPQFSKFKDALATECLPVAVREVFEAPFGTGGFEIILETASDDAACFVLKFTPLSGTPVEVVEEFLFDEERRIKSITRFWTDSDMINYLYEN